MVCVLYKCTLLCKGHEQINDLSTYSKMTYIIRLRLLSYIIYVYILKE